MNLSIQELLFYGIVTWRISSLLVNETGPFDIFLRIRKLTGMQYDSDGELWMIPGNVFAGILSCVWCCSVWVGAGISIFAFFAPGMFWLFLPFFLSAMAIVLEGKFGKQ